MPETTDARLAGTDGSEAFAKCWRPRIAYRCMLVRNAARTVPAVPLNSTKVRAALTWMPVKLWLASHVVANQKSPSEGPEAGPKLPGVGPPGYPVGRRFRWPSVSLL